jgi:protein SCO1/2
MRPLLARRGPVRRLSPLPRSLRERVARNEPGEGPPRAKRRSVLHFASRAPAAGGAKGQLYIQTTMAEKKPAPRMALGATVGVAVAILVGTGIASAPRRAPAFHGTTYTEVAPAARFSLVDQDGRPVSLDSYRGKPVLLFFGYTRCPDVCPTTLARLTRGIEDAGGGAEDIRVLLITLDPANDTPGTLKKYTGHFGPAVVGLTGDSAALATAWAGYGAYVEKVAAASTASAAHGGHGAHAPAAAAEKMVHTGVVYGIDRRGNLQVVISDSATPEQVTDDIRTLAEL